MGHVGPGVTNRGGRTRAGRARASIAGARGGRRGAALILTLLVLAILVVLVVQLAFTVKVEERIVRNAEDDAAFELAGARGAIPLVAALFRDDRKNGNPGGALDTLADVWSDPSAEQQRTFQVGEVQVELLIEDLERRLPLPWLADAQRAAYAEVALRRLLEKLKPTDADPAELAKAIAERVRSVEGVQLPEGGGGAPAPAPSQGPATRRLVSLVQLLAGAEGGGGADPGAGGGGGSAGGGAGVDRKVLWGDPEAEPPTQGIAAYVTLWPVEHVNLNTALPEVLFALLPEKNAGQQSLWEVADDVVDAVRRRRIDPDRQTKGGPEGSQPAPTGELGASRSWGGAAFEKVDDLASQEIHERLRQLFQAQSSDGGTAENGDGTGGAPAPGGGGAPAPGGGGAAGQQQQFGLQQALGVESRWYAVRVTTRRTGGGDAMGGGAPGGGAEGEEEPATGRFRLVLHRAAQDEVTPLWVSEDAGP